MATTPTNFSWPAGPETVQVSGDWDNWAEKIDLNKQADGSFAKDIPLPENKRVHFKFIVDSNWTTKQGAPTVDDNGNVNNIIDVGPAPQAAKQETGSAAAPVAAAGAVAGAGAVTAGAVAASQTGKVAEPVAAVAPTTKAAETKPEPAQPIKEVADGDVRNAIPSSVTSLSHSVVPVVAGTIAATVTGADVFRGHPETLPVSNAEKNAVQAQATQQPASVGAAITQAAKAPTDNSQAGVNTATQAAATNKLDAPATAVNEAGFASNVDGARLASGKQGGEAAGAIASVNHSTASAPTSAAPKSGETLVKEAEKTLPTTPKKETSGLFAKPVVAAAPAAAPVAAAPAAPAPVPAKTAATPAAAPAKTAPSRDQTPISQTAGTSPEPLAAAPVAPSTPTKKSYGSGTVRDKSQKSSRHVSEASAATEGDERKRKGFFGKIKSALSPHSSPSK